MASKNIIAKGATYNGVESITLPTSPSGTATFYEVSDTTATASDVLNSKYFYTAAGVKTQGTGTAPSPTLITKNITQNGTYDAEDDDADGYSSVTVSVSGGGSGLVYETGTWTPTADVADYWIPFTNTHTDAPFAFLIADATGDYDDTTYSNYAISYANWEQAFGTRFYLDNNVSFAYGRVLYMYRGTSATAISTGNTSITEPLSSTIDYASGYPHYWAKETAIRASTVSASRYWRSGRTYKWIAVWAPTT